MDFMLSPGQVLPLPELEVIPVAPGDEAVIGDLSIQVGPSLHNVPSVSYRISRQDNGKEVSMVYSGDTGYCPALGAFSVDADLLNKLANTVSTVEKNDIESEAEAVEPKEISEKQVNSDLLDKLTEKGDDSVETSGDSKDA